MRAVIENRALAFRTAAVTSLLKYAESARRIRIPVAPDAVAVMSASATNRWAPFALFVDPLRSRVAVMTGALVGVLTIPISAFRPLTPV